MRQRAKAGENLLVNQPNTHKIKTHPGFYFIKVGGKIFLLDLIKNFRLTVGADLRVCP
jgi:hypothetical protein